MSCIRTVIEVLQSCFSFVLHTAAAWTSVWCCLFLQRSLFLVSSMTFLSPQIPSFHYQLPVAWTLAAIYTSKSLTAAAGPKHNVSHTPSPPTLTFPFTQEQVESRSTSAGWELVGTTHITQSRLWQKTDTSAIVWEVRVWMRLSRLEPKQRPTRQAPLFTGKSWKNLAFQVNVKRVICSMQPVSL